MVCVEFNNFSISIGGRRLFHNLSFSLNEGDRLLIKGPSGVGKSLFIKSILGFVSFEGTLAVKGNILTYKNINRLRLNMAYVPQNTDVFWGKLKDNLKEIFSARANKNTNFSLKDFLKFIENFDLKLKEEMLERVWSDFSGGERQKILIAIAYFLKRDIFLLDEPTSALDEESKKKIVSFFNNLDKTIIVASHDKEWEALDRLQRLVYEDGQWLLVR